jgi:DNA topoisomerase-3
VLVKPGWLAIYGKEAADEVADAKDGDKGQNLVPVQPRMKRSRRPGRPQGLKTKPPARYSEATLLGAMEGAGKTVEDDELREAMQEKGLGTPATRSSIIEGLIAEKYMLREGRELIPTAKAFQLMTLLRGLGVEELSKAELTGEWEYKLAQMEHGKMSRTSFMAEIAAMTERMVKKAKEYDRDTIPGDYATLQAPCPNCGGIVKENYRRYTCTGKTGTEDGCGFSFGKSPAGRTFEHAEVEQFLARPSTSARWTASAPKPAGPLWPRWSSSSTRRPKTTNSNSTLVTTKRARKAARSSTSPPGVPGRLPQVRRGTAAAAGGTVFEHGKNYVCEIGSHARPPHAQLRLQNRPDHPAATH